MLSICQPITLFICFSSFIHGFRPNLYKLSSNSQHEWNPSNQMSPSSSSSSSSSSSAAAALIKPSSLTAFSSLPYSSDTNSYAYWNCHTIPPNMTLCKSVGYSRMVLPNFLQHESLREAIQQANVWITLVNTDCHPDIQRFLCSLYAPVCLKSHQEAKIPPCWELCNQVRDSCLPRMRLFGFDWPDIVRCQQFPRLTESMCIPPQEKSTTVTCVPCEQAITLENIASSYCMADVVLKASVKDMILQPNQASIILNLTPRTLALKLIRNDGTQLSSIDQYRRKRNSRRKRNNQHHKQDDDDDGRIYQLRTVRDLKISKQTRTNNHHPDQYQSKYLITPKSINTHEQKTNKKRRRRPRNSRLHDLDGITELVLSCSSCSPLLPFTSGRLASSLPNQKWLVMGRRIQDSSTKKYTNQLQVTFLSLWNRESTEFRQSLNAIRKESVENLCNKNQASLSIAVQPQSVQNYPSGRPLKILRSAPSRLSDSPNFNEMYKSVNVNKKSPHSLVNSNDPQYYNRPIESNEMHHYYQPPKSKKSSYQHRNTTTHNDFSSHFSSETNNHNFKMNDAQPTTYLHEIDQLQRQQHQKPRKSNKYREHRKKWKSPSSKVSSQNQYNSNPPLYQLPINPYSD